MLDLSDSLPSSGGMLGCKNQRQTKTFSPCSPQISVTVKLSRNFISPPPRHSGCSRSILRGRSVTLRRVPSKAHDCAGESVRRLWSRECYQRGDNGTFGLFRVCLFSAVTDVAPILTSNSAKAFDRPFRGLDQRT